MKTIKTLGAVVMFIFSVNIYAQQTRTVGDFTGIKVGDDFDVVISQSDANTVKVTAPDSAQAHIKTEVKDGILIISAYGKVKTHEQLELSLGGKGLIGEKTSLQNTITIGIKSLATLEVTGSAEVKSANQLTCEKLSIKTNGVGDVYLDVRAKEIKTSISGDGNDSLRGTTALLEAEVSGAGDLNASNLETDKAKVKASGAGDVKINVKTSLDADVSGAGSVIYKGNPLERNVNISGAGSVRESKSGNGEETAGNPTKIRLGKKKYMIIGDNDEDENYHAKKMDSISSYNHDFKHWGGIEFGMNGYLDYDNTLNVAPNANFLELNYAKSYQFGANLFEKDIHIYNNYVNLVMGLGFDFNHYAFKNKMAIKADTTYIWGIKDSTNYKKNMLNISYVTVPLLLEFNTSKNPHNDFHIAVGVELEYRIHSVTKQKFDLDDHHYRVKQRDDFNLEPFKASTVVRVGYNHVTLFADYGLTRLFQKDKGPQEYPFTVGITISM